MEAGHVLEHVRHLHSDVARQTMDVLARLEIVAKVVIDAAARVEKGIATRGGVAGISLDIQAKQIVGAINGLHANEMKIQELALGELQSLTIAIDQQVTRLENVAATVKGAATEVNTIRSAMHRQNEAILMGQVQEITTAVKILASLEGQLQETARRECNVVIAPLADSLSKQIENVFERNTFAANYLKNAIALESRASSNTQDLLKVTKYAIAGTLLLCATMFLAGLYIGKSHAASAEISSAVHGDDVGGQVDAESHQGSKK